MLNLLEIHFPTAFADGCIVQASMKFGLREQMVFSHCMLLRSLSPAKKQVECI